MLSAREEPDEAAWSLVSARDTLRSARRWRDLLTAPDRRAMLSDIAAVGLAVGRDLYPERGLTDLDIVDSTTTGELSPRERLAFLAQSWPRIAHALHVIENAPPPALAPNARLVSTVRARRVRPRDLIAAVRSGDMVLAPERIGPLTAALGGLLPRRVVEHACEPGWDTPANRAVKAMLVRFARDLSVIAALAQQSENAPGVAAEAARLRTRVRTPLRREPWRMLPPPLTASTAFMLPPALRAHGPYRLLYSTYDRYRRLFCFDWDCPVFRTPSRETWLLYEYWCLFRVASVLRALGYQTTRADDFVLSRGGLTFTLTRGTASRLVFRHSTLPPVTLTYNPDFPRAAEGYGGWHSRSHALRPDMALETEGCLLLLDAKFKTYAAPFEEGHRFAPESLVPDIRQMHSYRDGVAHGARKNVVQGAWLLYCGRAANDQDNPRIVAYPRSIPERPFGNGDVGAILLRPNGSDDVLRALIVSFIGDSR